MRSLWKAYITDPKLDHSRINSHVLKMSKKSNNKYKIGSYEHYITEKPIELNESEIIIKSRARTLLPKHNGLRSMIHTGKEYREKGFLDEMCEMGRAKKAGDFVSTRKI